MQNFSASAKIAIQASNAISLLNSSTATVAQRASIATHISTRCNVCDKFNAAINAAIVKQLKFNAQLNNVQ